MAREQWNSQFGFLLAAVGSAVGLGNIWRFSYLAYEHGGGAFLIPYVVALLTAGIPLLILEYAVGHERVGSAPLLLLTLILVFWSVNLDGAALGLRAYITPDFAKLSQPKVWIDAYSQIFFTLSLGFGIMIAYASYLPDKANITGSAVLTAVINSCYSLLAGCAVFAVLGFMATSEGKPISEVVSQSIGLAFVAYPKAISLMPGGNIFGAVFFLCLTVAGLSSAISIFEAFVSAMSDKFGFQRRPMVSIISIIGFLGSIIFATQAGLLWLDIVDHFITHYGLIVVGILECFVVGWLFNISVLRNHVNRVSSLQLGIWWDLLIKFFIPITLLVICVGDLIKELQIPYGDYTWWSLFIIGVDWLLITIIAGVILALWPWQTDSHRSNGRSDPKSSS